MLDSASNRMKARTTLTLVPRKIDARTGCEDEARPIGGQPTPPRACCKKDNDCGAHCAEGAGFCGNDCQCVCKTIVNYNVLRCQKDIDCNMKCSKEGYCKSGL